MPSLSDRLKNLGVTVGAKNTQPRRRAQYPIETIVEGQIRDTQFGQTFVIETHYPQGYTHGRFPLALDVPMGMMSAWGKDARIANCPPEKYAFIDTETTGLATGSGTYAFLIGVGQYVADGFLLTQLFMRDPIEEPAQLALLDELLADCETIVSFNGKSFDVPLIHARYITNASPPPLKDAAHLDLLHLARRLWKQRLPSRTLGYLEEHILGQDRTEEDTPGWMIPQTYFDYLRSGDARPLKGVLYHNAMDIVALAALNRHMAELLEDPLNGRVEHPTDLVAIARLHADLGYGDKAVQIYEHALEQDLADEVLAATRKQLSMLQKRRGEFPLALSLWMQAAADRELYAHEELAKYYEHTAKDLAEAKKWTEAALAIVNQGAKYEYIYWEDELEHRLNRLVRRLGID